MSKILKMKFPGQWPQIAAVLQAGSTAADWDAAFAVCLSDRIEKRYLVPIGTLQNGPLAGEGFTILTIQCALIEFLAALKRGWNFRHGAPWVSTTSTDQADGFIRSSSRSKLLSMLS